MAISVKDIVDAYAGAAVLDGFRFEEKEDDLFSACVDGRFYVDLWGTDDPEWCELYVYPAEDSDALTQQPVYVKMCLSDLTAKEAALFVQGAVVSYSMTQFVLSPF